MDYNVLEKELQENYGFKKSQIEKYLNEEDSQLHVVELISNLSKKFGFSLKKSLVIGAGRGGLTCNLLNLGNEVTSLEPYFPYAQIIKYKLSKYSFKAEVINTTCEDSSLTPCAYDSIILMDVIEHVEDPILVLEKVHSALKNNGFAYLTVPARFHLIDPHYKMPFICWMPLNWADLVLKKLGRLKNDGLNGRQKLSSMHYYTHGAFIELAKSVGFDVIDVRALQNIEPDRYIATNGRFKKISKLMLRIKLTWLLNFLGRIFFGHRFLLVKK